MTTIHGGKDRRSDVPVGEHSQMREAGGSMADGGSSAPVGGELEAELG